MLAGTALGAVASSGGAGGGGLTAAPPQPSQTAGDIIGAQLQYAPDILSLTQAQAPQYQALQNQLLQQSLFGTGGDNGLLSLYQQAAPQLQSIQSGVNAQQAGANIGLVNQFAPQALAAYQAANPQLQQIQQTLTGMATTPQNPVGQISGGGWGQQFAQQVGQQVGAGMTSPQQIQGAGGLLANFNPQTTAVSPQFGVMAPGNETLNQLNQTAQQQLALGTSVSPQQQATLSNQVLSNYNQMGRANDPTAIAGLATSLDTYGQQLLQQRESNAAQAAGLTTTQGGLKLAAQQSNLGANIQSQLANQQALLQAQGLGLSGLQTQAGLTQQAQLANQQTGLASQQTNLAALLQGLGLQGSALNTAGQQSLAASQSNQQAQLANAQYQAQLLGLGGSLAQQTSINPFSLVTGQSGALGNALGSIGGAGSSQVMAQGLGGMYNPFNTNLMNTLTNAGTQTSLGNQNVNAGMFGGGLNMLGAGLGALMLGG